VLGFLRLFAGTFLARSFRNILGNSGAALRCTGK
jgi:hypothetical protein